MIEGPTSPRTGRGSATIRTLEVEIRMALTAIVVAETQGEVVEAAVMLAQSSPWRGGISAGAQGAERRHAEGSAEVLST